MRVETYNVALDDTGKSVLVRESARNYTLSGRNEATCSPDGTYRLMEGCFGLSRKAEEYVYMLALDAKSRLLGIFEVSHGGVNGSYVTPREIFVRALLCGAAGIVLVHNHPSGDPEPSEEDFAVTRRAFESGKLLNVPLLDHIVAGKDSYYSFRASGGLQAGA